MSWFFSRTEVEPRHLVGLVGWALVQLSLSTCHVPGTALGTQVEFVFKKLFEKQKEFTNYIPDFHEFLEKKQRAVGLQPGSLV